MTDILERRMDRLERRVARIETLHLRMARVERALDVPAALHLLRPPPTPTPRPLPTPPAAAPRRTPDPLAPEAPAPPPALGPAPQRAPAAAKPREPVDWERFFGLAVLGRVGVGAVLLAAGYFAQLAYKAMSHELKVLSIYALAGAFVGVGFLLRKRVAQRYIALLWGGGASAAYLAAAAARMRYGLVDPTVALVLLFGACVLGQVLARLLRHQTLASIALAGALAAPLLTKSPIDGRTFLMVYLLLVHAWSAWIENAWGWRTARRVAVTGTVLMAALWTLRHGAVDLSTSLHLHGYLVGLLAPELIAAARGLRVTAFRREVLPGVVGTVGIGLLLAGSSRSLGDMLPWLGVFAGAGWLGYVVLTMPHARASSRPMLRQLGVVGALLLTAGCYTFAHALPLEGALHVSVARGLALLGITALLLPLRRRFGIGEFPYVCAALLTAFATLLPLGDAEVAARCLLGVGACALVLWTARSPSSRGAVAWAGGITVAAGLMHAESHAWQVWTFAALGAWVAGAFAVARLRHDRRLEVSASILAGVALLGWLFGASTGHLASVSTPLLNAGTVAGAVLALLLVLPALPLLRARALDLLTRTWLWGAAAAVLLLAGHREVGAAVEALLPAAQKAWMTVYLAAAGVILAWIGRGRPRLVARAGLLLAAGAGLKMLLDYGFADASSWAALQFLAPLAGLLGTLFLVRKKRDDDLHVLLAVVLLVCAGGWALYALRGRFPVDAAFLNLRFLTGLAAAGALLLFPIRRLPRADRRALGGLLFAGALALGYLAGHAEVAKAVSGLSLAAQKAWITAYMAAAAIGLARIGRDRPLWVRWSALLLVAGAGLKMLIDIPAIGASGWAALQFLSPLVALLGTMHVLRRTRDREIHRCAAAVLLLCALAWGLYAFTGRFPAGTAFVNARFAVALASIAALALFPLRRLAEADRRVVGGVLLLGALGLGYAAGLVEVAKTVGSMDDSWPDVLVSVYTTMFAAAALLAGFVRHDRRLRYAALGAFGVVVLKIGIHDLGDAAIPLRILVTGVLGLVLLAAAFAYARKQGPPVRPHEHLPEGA